MRADKFFAEHFGSRTKAAEAIEKGWVLLNGKTIRPKDEVRETDEIVFVQTDEYFVSNGGYKLSRALKVFSYSCAGKTFADIGASTGGFTDCLLQNGAKKVYAVDVGESLLHPSLCGDARIAVMENTNARYLTRDSFTERIDCVVTDVSFISLRLIFPAIQSILGGDGEALVLVKPQFECENKHIGKSGVVHPSQHLPIIERVLGYALEYDLFPVAITHAPIRKGKNIEYVLRLTTQRQAAARREQLLTIVKAFIKSGEEI